MRSALSGEVREHIGAPPQKAWALLASLEQMGQWSSHTHAPGAT